MFLRELFKEKKKEPTCAVLFFLPKETWNCKLEHILFYAFYNFYTVSTGAHRISRSGSLPGSALTQGQATCHMGHDGFFVMLKIKKNKKKSSASVKLFRVLSFFFFFLLTNDIITVQLLTRAAAWGAEGRGGRRQWAVVGRPVARRTSAPAPQASVSFKL